MCNRFIVLLLILVANCRAVAEDRSAVLTGIDVRLDRVLLYSNAFRHAGPDSTIRFSFKPARTIVWMRTAGSTVTPAITRPGQEIACALSIFSMDSPGRAIHVSFYSDGTNLANAIHVTHPRKRERTQIAAGLFLLTYPKSGTSHTFPYFDESPREGQTPWK